MEYEGIWQQVLDQLEAAYDEDVFSELFKPCYFVKFQNGNMIIAAPNEYITTKLNKFYINKINQILLKLNPNKEDNLKIKIIPNESVKEYTNKGNEFKKPENLSSKYRYNLNANYNFDNYVVGKSNRFAWTMAMKVADSQGGAVANPFYIFGSVGLGKTHLMEAIGNWILDKDANKRVLYVKASEFMEDYSKLSTTGRMDEFNEKYRDLDVLLIDDIQVLEIAKKTQMEFFKVFDILYSANKQIVITSDRPAKDLNIMDRLTSRFEEGLTVDIQTPALDHRIDIIKRKMLEANATNIDEEVYQFIAESFVSNIREIEGAVNRLINYCAISDIPINLENTKEALGALITSKKDNKVTTADYYNDIIGVVADFYNITIDEITGSSRKGNIVLARQIAMYILKTQNGLAYKKIGTFFGNRDHSTVMSSVEKIEHEMANDAGLKLAIQTITKKIS